MDAWTLIKDGLLPLCAGLAFFLYGMSIMSDSLEKMAGGKMEKTLKKMTSNAWLAMFLGMGITAVIQSSSAMTVMLVGLVNSGIMQLSQSIGVIMGANIGTTITAWVLTLAGISDGGPWWISLFKPSTFTPVLAIVGIFIIMMSKKQKAKDIATVMVAFAVLMFGMDLMGDAVGVIPNSVFENLFAALQNPLLGVLVGAVVTAVIQSSSASVGILQTVAITTAAAAAADPTQSAMTFAIAIPIIFGQNIGTCITSLISSIGANKNAKRVVVVHFTFNLIGTTLFMIAYYLLRGGLDGFLNSTVDAVGIATVHTVFNVSTTLMLLPLNKVLEKIAKAVVRDGAKEHPVGYLDERLLTIPSVAIVESKRQAVKMAELSRDTLAMATGLLNGYDETVAEQVVKNETMTDEYEDTLGSYLVKLSAMDLSARDGGEISKLLLSLADFERLGDHAQNIMHAAKEMNEKGLIFSDKARAELGVLAEAMNDIVAITVDAFNRSDLELASRVEPLEQVMDKLIAKVKARHIERLQQGKCTIELGFILNDLLTCFQRVSDHCSNVAVCLIQTKRDAFETHSYLNEVKTGGGEDFAAAYDEYKKTYLLPEA
ncbi:MAG: Na/Pi cotransporter family protein [Clostridia bacterium]|nr:Na/Pi cotransporter family protein [Clostridia bacterium]